MNKSNCEGNHFYMKRMIVFLLLIMLLGGILVFKENHRLDEFDYYKVTLVSKDYNDSLKAYASQNGNQYYYTFDNTQSDHLNLDSLKLDGIVYYINSSFNINKYLNRLDFFYQGKSAEGYQIYYGYDADLKDFVFVDGKKINVQLVKRSEDIVLGMPLILTGY